MDHKRGDNKNAISFMTNLILQSLKHTLLNLHIHIHALHTEGNKN